MSNLTRRDFIRTSMAVGAGLALATPTSRVLGANNDIRLGIVGVGAQGGGHMDYFSKIPGVRLVAIADVDKAHLEQRAAKFKKDRGVDLKTYTDFRKLLDDKEIDAITSATPNHWHALVTVWACQAGKDVYIEKPACHEIWEGRKMVEAARKYNRIVQIGTQKRSSEAHKAAYEWIRQGNIGKIKWSRGFCYKGRGPGTTGIVHGTNGPKPVPESVDYNMWCGPADMLPLSRTELHYVWHWMWNTGCGDIGNQGPHEMDLARWALGDPGLPTRAFSIGGRFGVGETGDVGETRQHPDRLLRLQAGAADLRGARPADEERRQTRRHGPITAGPASMSATASPAKAVTSPPVTAAAGSSTTTARRSSSSPAGGAGHHENFIKAVRSRNRSDQNADIEVGHLSAALCHMANTSYRLGKKMKPDEIKAALADNPEMLDSFNRMLEHLAANEVNLEKEPITMGPILTMDPAKEQYIGENSSLANMFIKRNYREPFVLPENV